METPPCQRYETCYPFEIVHVERATQRIGLSSSRVGAFSRRAPGSTQIARWLNAYICDTEASAIASESAVYAVLRDLLSSAGFDGLVAVIEADNAAEDKASAQTVLRLLLGPLARPLDRA